MKTSVVVSLALVLGTLLVESGQASVATNPNELFGGSTEINFQDYENAYNSSGNLVNIITTSLVTGDTIQGEFVASVISSPLSPYTYGSGAVGTAEITGVFDEYVTISGNQLMLTPDTTTATGQKAISGSEFQALYGTNSMLALFSNTSGNMPITGPTGDAGGNGLKGLSISSAWNLATTAGGGSLFASFGQGANQTWGNVTLAGTGGYYWGANAAAGVGTFAASLALITNDTSFLNGEFGPEQQLPPASTGLPTTFYNILNPFIIQGNLNPTDPFIKGTAFAEGSNDPAYLNINPIPEPSSFLVIGGLFAVWLAGLAAYRRKRIT